MDGPIAEFGSGEKLNHLDFLICGPMLPRKLNVYWERGRERWNPFKRLNQLGPERGWGWAILFLNIEYWTNRWNPVAGLDQIFSKPKHKFWEWCEHMCTCGCRCSDWIWCWCVCSPNLTSIDASFVTSGSFFFSLFECKFSHRVTWISLVVRW